MRPLHRKGSHRRLTTSIFFPELNIGQEYFICSVSLEDVRLSCNFPRSMHIVKRDTQVDYVHRIFSSDEGDRTAATLVYLTQFSHLIFDFVIIKNIAQFSNIFSSCIIGAAFAAASGVLMQYRTIMEERSIIG